MSTSQGNNSPLQRETSVISGEFIQHYPPAQRRRPTPPLFDAPHILVKRQREGEEEWDASDSAAKRVRLNHRYGENDRTLIQSVEAEITNPNVVLGEGKRRRGADDPEEDDDLIELPPLPKRQRMSEVIDLTDD